MPTLLTAPRKRVRVKVRKRKSRPKHGPGADSFWSRESGWRVQLNDMGRAWILAHLAKYRFPLSPVIAKYPALVQAARVAGATEDDLQSAAMDGVVNAARLYRPGSLGHEGRECSFSSFANQGAYFAVQRIVTQSQAVTKNPPPDALMLYAGSFERGWDALELVEPLPDESAAELAERMAPIERELRRFNPRYVAIFRARWGLGGVGHQQTLDEVGRQFGISKERVRQIVDDLMKRIRQRLRDKGLIS